MVRAMQGRLPWENKFQTPSLEDLRGHYNKQLAGLFETARERLLSFDGVREEIAWHGVPWRWTLVYRADDREDRGWAYLVPDPTKPVLSLPLSTEMIEALPMRRLKRFVRDGIDSARVVGDVHWASWEISNKTELEDLLDLVKRKHRHESARN